MTALFAQYLSLAMQYGSAAQSPEKLLKERGLIATVLLLAAAFTATTFVNVPQLSAFAEQRYIFLAG